VEKIVYLPAQDEVVEEERTLAKVGSNPNLQIYNFDAVQMDPPVSGLVSDRSNISYGTCNSPRFI
jgi:hypothetical protein